MSPTAAPTPRFVIPALAAVYVIWGSTYLAMRIAVEGLPPFLMASTRFITTGVVLLLFLRARGTAWPTRREWLYATPVGTLMFVLGNGTVAVAEKHLSSGVAAVVCGTMPLWVAALGRFFGEKTSPREWLALVLGLHRRGGVVLRRRAEGRAAARRSSSSSRPSAGRSARCWRAGCRWRRASCPLPRRCSRAGW